jgi:hypothetical protein
VLSQQQKNSSPNDLEPRYGHVFERIVFILHILRFACTNPVEVIALSKVASAWREALEIYGGDIIEKSFLNGFGKSSFNIPTTLHEMGTGINTHLKFLASAHTLKDSMCVNHGKCQCYTSTAHFIDTCRCHCHNMTMRSLFGMRIICGCGGEMSWFDIKKMLCGEEYRCDFALFNQSTKSYLQQAKVDPQRAKVDLQRAKVDLQRVKVDLQNSIANLQQANADLCARRKNLDRESGVLDEKKKSLCEQNNATIQEFRKGMNPGKPRCWFCYLENSIRKPMRPKKNEFVLQEEVVKSLDREIESLNQKVESSYQQIRSLGQKVESLGWKVESLGWKVEFLSQGEIYSPKPNTLAQNSKSNTITQNSKLNNICIQRRKYNLQRRNKHN